MNREISVTCEHWTYELEYVEQEDSYSDCVHLVCFNCKKVLDTLRKKDVSTHEYDTDV